MRARIVETRVDIGEHAELIHRTRALLGNGQRVEVTVIDPDHGQPRDVPRWSRILTAIRRALRPQPPTINSP